MSKPYVSELQGVINNFYSLLETEHKRRLEENPQLHHPSISFDCEICAALDTYRERYPWIHATERLNH